MPLERLHKVLAHAGFGSRRKCEQMIRDGLVQVDGKTVTEMGVKVDPGQHKIKCDGRYLRAERTVVLLLNKPRRIICTTHDEHGRRTVNDLMHGVRERVYPVGRLDSASQGMVVMTNDGDLTNRLTHPRYGVSRTYHVVVQGEVTPEHVEKMSRGVWLAEGKTGPIQVSIKKRDHGMTILEATIHEGMNREVRRVFAKYGFKVKHLKRVKIGQLMLGQLPEGRYRALTPKEIEMLFAGARSGEKIPPKNPKVKDDWKRAPAGARKEEAGSRKPEGREDEGSRKEEE